jgi:DNA-binding PadR family transcriptional regulator
MRPGLDVRQFRSISSTRQEKWEVLMGRDILGSLEQSVLYAILRLRNDAYGVGIQQEIASQTGREMSFGSIYTTLDRLEKKGFVLSRTGEATAVRGGRAKKYFQVTGAGQAALHSAQRAIDALRHDLGTAGV